MVEGDGAPGGGGGGADGVGTGTSLDSSSSSAPAVAAPTETTKGNTAVVVGHAAEDNEGGGRWVALNVHIGLPLTEVPTCEAACDAIIARRPR